MELPITRPSMMSYADQIDFNELLGKLKSDRCNGFIRVTSGPMEGHILFKDGNQVAASFDKYTKIEAIERIRSTTEDANALIEVFDLKESQLDYLMDINKTYLINFNSKADNIREEIIKSESLKTENIKSSMDKEEIKPEEQSLSNSHFKDVINEIKATPETNKESITIKEVKKLETHLSPEINEPINEEKSNIGVSDENHKINIIEDSGEPSTNDINNALEVEKTEINTAVDISTEEKVLPEDIGFKESSSENMDRSEIMKKYGLKDVQAEEVENLLESYKGGDLSDDDVEKVELTLMNKIKKSILGIPKIKGTEVIVFLDNSNQLLGTINIISEYESKGLISRIIGDSKDSENLRTQIINITEIEIRKSFRGYPEIVDNFEINVEFS